MTDAERKAALGIAAEIADITSAIINLNRNKIDHPYAVQWLLEEVIANLQDRV